MTPPLEYSARTSLLEAPRTYLLAGDTLWARPHPKEGGGPPPVPQEIRLADIVEMRLRYFPTRMQPNRYECLLKLRHGRSLKITNEFFRGAMTFDDRSPAYREFVTALARALATHHPSARFQSGRSTIGYIAEMGFVGVVFVVLAIVLLTIGTLGSWLIWMKLALIAVFVPVLLRYVRKNVPRRFDPHQLPRAILPA